MTLILPQEFKLLIHNKKGRLLGLDVGEKTIGLAISDVRFMIATPLKVIARSKWKVDFNQLKDVIHQQEVIGLVIGLPVNMNGTEGPRCQSVRQFSNNILQDLTLPICFWDERYSTSAVTKILLEADMSREKRKQVVDKMAAAYILQGFLDM